MLQQRMHVRDICACTCKREESVTKASKPKSQEVEQNPEIRAVPEFVQAAMNVAIDVSGELDPKKQGCDAADEDAGSKRGSGGKKYEYADIPLKLRDPQGDAKKSWTMPVSEGFKVCVNTLVGWGNVQGVF